VIPRPLSAHRRWLAAGAVLATLTIDVAMDDAATAGDDGAATENGMRRLWAFIVDVILEGIADAIAAVFMAAVIATAWVQVRRRRRRDP
jgi:hypothetical protein